MKLLEERILRDGKVIGKDILKVDSFINHRIDVPFLTEVCAEFKKLYAGEKITKILTIESSGIAIATLTALFFGAPVVFAKKTTSRITLGEFYTTEVRSFTHGNVNHVIVSKDYLTASDRVLLVDDFLAEGCSLEGLLDLCAQAGASVAGCGVLVEKVFEGGGDRLRKKTRVEALARIAHMDESGIVFAD